MTQKTALHRSIPLVRELVRTYQAFEQLSTQRIRLHGLTHPQFDVIATLGNTAGMSCRELSERTLITKGTLTGVLDRLLEKGLITRTVPEHDRRSLFVALTPAGEAVFNEAFPDVIEHCGAAMDYLDDAELAHHITLLAALRAAIGKKLEQAE
ncbi:MULTISPECIES: MarR family winged helix-turn-helix transcriptional regulator [Vogesella]|jgi:DNA-binding MarR family transcriptional regulator|uniref:MarR family winged helix-turn-helix transcriptional regulator n=1 Tax=Vogesella TaxID=57739 RepID=UPI0011853E8E|nr:MarR family transcriptional regulator [Vogesella urethralis]MEC5206917.1 MarR family 2-MHQ and catechol resistance regulon transcriptional repressor [Vogesella perlucida]